MIVLRAIGFSVLLVIGLGACQSGLQPKRVLIEDLDRRLGTAPALDGTGGVRTKKAAAATEQGSEARFARIVTMLRTGTPTEIDLQTVRQSMLANNLGLQASLLAPDIAAEELRAEQAKFEATFTLSAVRRRDVSPQYYGNVSTNITAESLTIVPGVTVPLQTGGSVKLDFSMATSDFESKLANESQKFSVVQPSIGVEQPLLRNAGLDYNEASIVLALAKEGGQRSAAQIAVINQLLAAEAGYWSLYRSWRALEINIQLYETARDLLEGQRELVRHNTGSVANVYNFEVALAQAVDNVLGTERDLRLAVRNLKKLMQDPRQSLHSSMSLKPSTKPVMIAYEFNPQRLVQFALDNRADLLQLEYTRIQREIEVMTSDNQLLPSVDLLGGYTFNGFDANRTSLGSAYGDLFDGTEPGGWSAGVNVSVPIGNKSARSNYRAALLRRLQAIADVRNREITVTSEVLDAIDTAETRWQQVIASRYQEFAAERFFAAYETLFNRGQIASSNLTQALQAKGSSQIQTVLSEVQYQLALAQLAQSAGCLLGHSGVEWGPYLDAERLEEASPLPSAGLVDRFETWEREFSSSLGAPEANDEGTEASPSRAPSRKRILTGDDSP